MSITNHIRDKWRRFQGELFPEIQDAVGPPLEKHQRFVIVPEMVCPENFIRRISKRDGRPLSSTLYIMRGSKARIAVV